MQNNMVCFGVLLRLIFVNAEQHGLFWCFVKVDICAAEDRRDDKWKNARSTHFLKDCVQKIMNDGWKIENIDTIVILQNPKVSEFVPKIKTKLSQILHISESQMSVKATTTDHLGFIGKEMGWASQAIALLKKSSTLT